MFMEFFEDEKTPCLTGAVIIITTCEKWEERFPSVSNDQLQLSGSRE